MGQAVADGLDAKMGSVKAAAFRLVQAALAFFNTTGVLGDKHRAAGGPVVAGQSYIVGETRPETFVPTQNGVILPFAAPRVGPQSAGAAAAATVTNITNNYYQNTANVEGLVKARDPLEIARQLAKSARNGQFRPKLVPA